jgi:glycosyltransferase involved in cell wall biosynthesis
MRILLISTAFPPENSPGALRSYGFAIHWQRAGDEVTVLTTQKTSRDLELATEGVRVLEVDQGSPLPRRLGSAGAGRCSSALRRLTRPVQDVTGIYSCARMPDETDGWVGPATRTALLGRPWDVVVSSSGPYTVHRVAYQVKRAGAARWWVMDFRDLWTRNHCFTGLFPFTILERRLERRFLREADLVSTVSAPLATALSQLARGSVHVVPNGHDPDLATPLAEKTPPADGMIRLVYTGSLYLRGQDPRPLLCALAEVGRTSRELAERFRLIVAGPSWPRWERLGRETGALRFLDDRGFVGRREAWRLQSQASCLVALDWNPPTAGVVTSKVYEYLFARAPIVAIGGSDESVLARLLEETGRGRHLGRSVPEITRFLESLARADAPMCDSRRLAAIDRYRRGVIATDLRRLIRAEMSLAGASRANARLPA